MVRDIYTSASLIFNCARRRRGRQQNRKRCSQDAEQNRCATRRIHSGRAAMYPVFDHKKRKPRARSERVPHLPLDTAVPPLTSAASPTRKGGDWVFALSRGERVDRDRRFHQPVSWRGRVRGQSHGEDGSDGQHNQVTPHLARSARHPLPKGEG